MKTSIVYYSATGNTEMMANHLLGFFEDKGFTVSMDYVSDITVDDVSDSELLVLGSPAMGVEEIEEYEFRPFFDDLKPFLPGKKVILFGSYDWGEGEWMDAWQDEAKEAGADVIATLIVNLDPDMEALEAINEVLNAIY